MHKFRILLIHGAGVHPRNAGDDAQAVAALERLERLLPGCEVIPAKVYDSDDGSLWPTRMQAASPHLYLFGKNAFMKSLIALLRRMQLTLPAAWLAHLCLITRGIRLLLAAKAVNVLGFILLYDARGREVLSALRQSDAVYLSGGGNLNDIWLRQELLPRMLACRTAHLLGKPVFVSGQGVGPLTSRLGTRLLRWGTKHVQVFACRDKEESAAQLRSLGLAPDIIKSFGDDAADLRCAGRTRGTEILESEGVSTRESRPVAIHVRFTDFSQDFRDIGVPFMTALCDGLVKQLGCNLVFIPITHARRRSYDEDIGDAFEVFSRMAHRHRAGFLCRERYSPPEIKATISCCQGLIGFSYHAWVFALTSGVPALALFHGEYFRKKAAGLFAWYNHPEWMLDISTGQASGFLEKAVSVMKHAGSYRRNLEDTTRELVGTVEAPALMLAKILERHARELGLNETGNPSKFEVSNLQ